MNSQIDSLNFSFTLRSRKDNNDPDSVKELSDLVRQKYGNKYLKQFINNNPYRNEKAEIVKKVPARHFTSVPTSIRIPQFKKTPKIDDTKPLFGVYPAAPDLDETCAFRVVYGIHKPTKKHKQWTDDGYILIEDRALTIYDETGKIISTAKPAPFSRYVEGEQFIVGTREYEISTRLDPDDIKMGKFR